MASDNVGDHVDDHVDDNDDSSWDALLEDLTRARDDDAGEFTWVTLPDAAAAAGVSRSTLRSWFRTGQVPSRLEPGLHGPQRVVPRELVMERALQGRGRLGGTQAEPGTQGAHGTHGTHGARITPGAPPERSLAELYVTAATDREQRLEARVAELEAEVRAMLGRAVAAETELRLWHAGWRPHVPGTD